MKNSIKQIITAYQKCNYRDIKLKLYKIIMEITKKDTVINFEINTN